MKALFIILLFCSCTSIWCDEFPLQTVEITFENGIKDTVVCRHPLGIVDHNLVTIAGGCDNDTEIFTDSVMDFKIISY